MPRALQAALVVRGLTSPNFRMPLPKAVLIWAIFLATSIRNGLEQVLGRILRAGSDPSIPRIVHDLVDIGTIFTPQLLTRNITYIAKNCECVETKVGWWQVKLP